jgi:hypothetical protein
MLPGRLYAQTADPRAVQPERPTVATHAGTVAPRFMELEAGIEVDHFRGVEDAVIAPLILKIGVASHLQLNLQNTLSRPGGGALGSGDVGLGLKWRLLDHAPVLGNFAVLPGIKFPTGSSDAGRGTGTTDVSLLLISSHNVGPIAIDLNAGYTRRSGDGTEAPRDATVWTASFGGPFYENAGWVLEFFGFPETSGVAGSAGTVALLAGPTVVVKPWFSLDAGIIVKLSGPQPRALYLGGVYNFGRF